MSCPPAREGRSGGWATPAPLDPKPSGYYRQRHRWGQPASLEPWQFQCGMVLLVAVWPALSHGLVLADLRLICALAYNFFFLRPLLLHHHDPEMWSRWCLCWWRHRLNLTARVRTQPLWRASARATRTTASAQAGGHRLTTGCGRRPIRWRTCCGYVWVLPWRELFVRAGYPPGDTLTRASHAAAKWAFQQGQEAGAAPTHCPAQAPVPALRTARGWWRSSAGFQQKALFDARPAAALILSDQTALAVNG